VPVGHVEAERPAIIENLAAIRHHQVDDDVLDPRHVPQEPRQRVEALARARPHLAVRQPREDAVGVRPAPRDLCCVQAAVLDEKEAHRVHRSPPGLATAYRLSPK
jgi:hypothetical protein